MPREDGRRLGLGEPDQEADVGEDVRHSGGRVDAPSLPHCMAKVVGGPAPDFERSSPRNSRITAMAGPGVVAEFRNLRRGILLSRSTDSSGGSRDGRLVWKFKDHCNGGSRSDGIIIPAEYRQKSLLFLEVLFKDPSELVRLCPMAGPGTVDPPTSPEIKQYSANCSGGSKIPVRRRIVQVSAGTDGIKNPQLISSSKNTVKGSLQWRVQKW